jgi:hypothetical protein
VEIGRSERQVAADQFEMIGSVFVRTANQNGRPANAKVVVVDFVEAKGTVPTLAAGAAGGTRGRPRAEFFDARQGQAHSKRG